MAGRLRSEEIVMVTAGVPAGGPARLGSVQLPVGKRLSGWRDDTPALWATSEPVPDARQVRQALTDLHQDTGLREN
jgi:hypothetical protein